jgi:DsbC/DsbD-like thiol-disulfide interchange protein
MRIDECQRRLKFFRCWGFALAATLLTWHPAAAQPRDSSAKVKTSAVVGPIEQGKQTATITLTVEKGWHIYANPVGNEIFEPCETCVHIKAHAAPAKVDIQFPAGTQINLPATKLKLMIYEGKIDIPVVVQRTAGDTSPLEIEISFLACSTDRALLPARVTLNAANGYIHMPKK